MRHFPITWKNQILTPSYSVFYMPLSFPGKKIGQNETLSNYMEKPNLDSFLLCILYLCLFHFPEKISAKMRHFPITWKNQILTIFNFVCMLYATSFSRKNPKWPRFYFDDVIGQIDTLFHYMIY